MTKKSKRAQQAPTRQRPPSRAEAIASGIEQSFLHNDSRVIARVRDVAQYELSTVEDHIVALKASLAEQQTRKERLEAKINGLTRVLSRR